MRVRLGCFRSIVATVVALVGLTACTKDHSSATIGASEQTTAQGSPKVQSLVAPHVPDGMKAPEGEVVVQKFRAHGVQIYACVGTGGDAGGVAWEHQAPETDLTDDTGQRVGRHYAGPTWESTDGSKVVGELVKKVPAADGRGVHWLLMRAKATLGTGIFSKVTSIQRVDTVGGKPPTQGCDSTTLGNTERVPYEGTYYFYARP